MVSSINPDLDDPCYWVQKDLVDAERERDELRAENERLRRRLRSARSFLDDSQRPEWTDKERAIALAACYRQLDMA